MSTDPLDARVRIPAGVVRRAFADETIVLHLGTGQYHGLNPTAAAMVDALAAGTAPRQVAADVAAQAGVAPARVEADLRVLLAGLRERELIEIDG